MRACLFGWYTTGPLALPFLSDSFALLFCDLFEAAGWGIAGLRRHFVLVYLDLSDEECTIFNVFAGAVSWYGAIDGLFGCFVFFLFS